jgi:hypothetical protein
MSWAFAKINDYSIRTLYKKSISHTIDSRVLEFISLSRNFLFITCSEVIAKTISFFVTLTQKCRNICTNLVQYITHTLNFMFDDTRNIKNH